MRYRVRHKTTYKYAGAVDLASHMLHLLPRQLTHQRVISANLSADPDPARVHEGTDHFGNRVAWMFLNRPHDKFVVTLDAEVDVAFPPAPSAETPAWETIAAQAFGDRAAWQAAEFAFESPMLAEDIAATAYVAESFPAGRPILEGLLHLNSRIRREFTFKGGITEIDTPVSKVLALRAGVCQDFTHLLLTGLRGLGLPARYVSGYLRTYPPAGEVTRRGADQSHAWVGAWLGPEHGWIDLDPTNDLVVSEEHVVLAWGRDYGDISPVRGILLGGGRHTVAAEVRLEPVG